jgi:UDP-glucose:glycoprotein glucosyltransferase
MLPFRVAQGLVLLLLCTGWLQSANSASQKIVQISVSAPWGPAPLVLEAAEYFEGDNKDLFWSYVQSIPVGALSGSDKKQHETIVETVSKFASKVQIDLLNFALALRNNSPKLEMHRNLWDDAKAASCSIDSAEGAVVIVGTRCISQAKDLHQAVQQCVKDKSIHPIVHDMDHVYPSSQKFHDGMATAILYATIGTDSFLSMHNELVKLAQDGSVRYVFRHTWSSWRQAKTADQATIEPLTLQGYGAELAVKNMEYKAVDDSKVNADGQAIEGAESESDEVGGFDFKVLLERKPDLVKELQSFRETLTTEVSGSDNLKVWTLKDIGIQASQHIMQVVLPPRNFFSCLLCGFFIVYVLLWEVMPSKNGWMEEG